MPNLAAELHLCSEIPTGEITRGSMEFLLLPPPHDSQKPTLLTTANAFQGNWTMAEPSESTNYPFARCQTASDAPATSALVGIGSTMDSNSWGVTTTGLFCYLHSRKIFFCADGTCSNGICAAKSLLATMAPSDTWMISSKFFQESMLSILASTATSHR